MCGFVPKKLYLRYSFFGTTFKVDWVGLNVLLIALSSVFVILSSKLVWLSLNPLVYSSNLVSMSITCVCNWIGIQDALVSLACELRLLLAYALD